MQIYADVTGREIAVAASRQTPALGAAMFGAVAAGAAAGGYDSIVEASQRMARLSSESFAPGAEPRTPSTTSSTPSTSACTTCSGGTATARCRR